MDYQKLKETYIEEILSSVDMDTLYDIARGALENNLSTYTNEQMFEEIKRDYPHILEEDE